MINALSNLIGIPLGFVMRLIYDLVGNYGIAIILFTLVTRLILLPVSYKQQKNAARQQLLNPKIAKLREKYGKDPNRFSLEQTKLMQEENINPYASCLTSFIPLLLLWGVLAVVYQPMTFILQYDKPVIEEAKAIVISIDEDKAALQKSLQGNQMRQELILMDRMVREQDAFAEAVEKGTVKTYDNNGEETGEKLTLTAIDNQFMADVVEFSDTFTIGKTNLSETPSTNFSENSTVFLFLIPILSGVAQLLMTIYMQYMQKKRNPDMPNMGCMNAMLFGMPLFSIWLAFTVPAGVGFYWLCSSVIGFAQSALLYAWFNEKRVEKIGEAERKKAQKARRRPSMMQRIMEQQEELLREQESSKARLGGGPTNRVRYSDDDGERKLSRSELEEYNTAVIREARRRMAEKYGETIEEAPQSSQNNKKKKKK